MTEKPAKSENCKSTTIGQWPDDIKVFSLVDGVGELISHTATLILGYKEGIENVNMVGLFGVFVACVLGMKYGFIFAE